MASIGSWAVGLSLLVALYAAVSAFAAARRQRSLEPRSADERPSLEPPLAGERTRQLIKSAHNALWAVAALVSLGSILLLYSLITHDFQIRYVYQYTSTHLPLVYRISAFWAGQEGSLLLWLWFVAILAVMVAHDKKRRGKVKAYLLGVLALVEAFLALLVLVTSNPFVTQATSPAEGIGMLPLLENPGMVVHPPVLFLGYAAYTVPFAFALAALLSGELGTSCTERGMEYQSWVKAMRRWNLFAWLALGTGILIGAWWSYVELGWGGYWAWDPVENASLIPWLVGTASLHSVIIEERRGMHKVWNLVLPTLAFVLCMFATLVTRGGIILSDLHGFSRQTQPIAYYLLAFILGVLGWSFALLYRRRCQLASERRAENLVSRETLFLLVNVLFCGAALIVFLGTVYPSLARSAGGVMLSLNASFYNRAVGPLMTLIICLIGVCPVIGWRRLSPQELSRFNAPSLAALVVTVVAFILGVTKPIAIIAGAICAFVIFSLLAMLVRDWLSRRRSTGENYVVALVRLVSKGRRRYGAHLVHLAVVLVAIGITGSSFYQESQLVALDVGEATDLGGYRIQYDSYAVETLNAEPVTYQSRVRYSTRLSIYRKGTKVATLVPEKNYHWALNTPWVTEVAIHSDLKEDIYVILASLEESGLAGFQIIINPLVSWIWLGGAVLSVGTVLAAWPQRQADAQPRTERGTEYQEE
jgi:cytochrome c-type biogenesis protein CcmF